MKISIIDPTIDSRWDEFVDSHENGTIFHTSAWAAVIKEAYGYLPRYYILENKAGQFRAGIPLYLVRSRLTGMKFICLPFSDYCYPLSNDPADITLLLNSVKEDIKAGAASHLEIRGWQNVATPAQSELVTKEHNLRHILDLEPCVNVLKERFHHSVRRCIHQAEKRGVTVRMTRTEADLDHFYKLNVTTHKKLAYCHSRMPSLKHCTAT